MFHFYYAAGTCALASHIVLEQSGCAYRAHRVDFARNEQRASQYLAVNPKGRVPALVTPRGAITETPAILLFVAQSAPSAQLAPLDDPFELAQAQAFNAYLCSTVHVASAHRGRGARWADDAQAIQSMKRKVRQNMIDCFKLIETAMMRGPWVMGDRYTICDAYLYTMAGLLSKDDIDVAQFPKVAAQSRRMANELSVQRVLRAEHD